MVVGELRQSLMCALGATQPGEVAGRVLEVESLSSLNLVDEFLNVRIIHRHTSTGTNSSSAIVF